MTEDSSAIANHLKASFATLEATEPYLHTHQRRPEELLRPSGSFEAPIAHHLRNPTFATDDLTKRETADETNPSLSILLENGFNDKNSLIFDHLARRDAVDGFKAYPQAVIDSHERFLAKLRSGMKAVVEIAYGNAVQKRLLRNNPDWERCPLWGEFSNVPVYLERSSVASGVQGAQSRLQRFVVFAYHPQKFVLPYGPQKWGPHQDVVMKVAAKLAKLEVEPDYHQRLTFKSRIQFEKNCYKLKTVQPNGNQAPSNESPHSTIFDTNRAKVAQGYDEPMPEPMMNMTATELPLPEEAISKDSTQRASDQMIHWKMLIREPLDTKELPDKVMIWCQVCHEDTKVPEKHVFASDQSEWPIDRSPRWTKGEPPKYIERQARCWNCKPGQQKSSKSLKTSCRFIPVDPGIPSIEFRELHKWVKKHALMDIDYMVKAVAAKAPMPRDRGVESNPTKGGRPSQKKRLAQLEAPAVPESASQKGDRKLSPYQGTQPLPAGRKVSKPTRKTRQRPKKTKQSAIESTNPKLTALCRGSLQSM